MKTTDLVEKAVAAIKQRSYWRLRYRDGRTLSEWDADWSDIPREGRVALRLYCPNGQIAELGNSEDATDRLFQLKEAEMRVTNGKPNRSTLAQIIGLIQDTKGNCQCYAWNYRTQQIEPFFDNVLDFKYHNIGPLNPEVLGIRP